MTQEIGKMDNEIKGRGNSLNYKYRMHDPRIGRFFAVDPLTAKYPWYTPYQFSGNKVIQYVELEGLEEYEAKDGTYIGTVGDDQSTRVMTGIASADSPEGKKVQMAIKLLNAIENKINEDIKGKPQAVIEEYFNSKTNPYVQAYNELHKHLFNSSEEKSWTLSSLEIGTSLYWTDGPSSFSYKDLGDGKVSFYLPDSDLLFSFAGNFKPWPKGTLYLDYNGPWKIGAKVASAVKTGLKGVKEGAQVYKAVQKKIEAIQVEATTIKYNYQCINYKDGILYGGGYYGDYESLEEAKKHAQEYIKKNNLDSIHIYKYGSQH